MPTSDILSSGSATNTPTNNGAAVNSKIADVKADSSSLASEFRNFVADVEDLIKATTSLSGEDLAKAKAKLNERIASAKHTAEDLGESIAARARKTAECTNAYVHEQPWTAVGAGAAAGLLLGYLLARRS
jgi:ElaB/YqjD/DUF883 family membrane-anchored ribosome-binding protein